MDDPQYKEQKKLLMGFLRVLKRSNSCSGANFKPLNFPSRRVLDGPMDDHYEENKAKLKSRRKNLMSDQIPLLEQ